MSQDNPEKNVEQVAAEKLSAAAGTDVSIEQAEKLNEKLYENLFKNLYKELNQDNVTKRNVIRGVFNALDLGVDSGLAPELMNEKEAMIGGYFAQLMDKRLIILGRKLREQELKELETKKETENVTETK